MSMCFVIELYIFIVFGIIMYVVVYFYRIEKLLHWDDKEITPLFVRSVKVLGDKNLKKYLKKIHNQFSLKHVFIDVLNGYSY